MTVIWDEEWRPLSAKRIKCIGTSEIKELLRSRRLRFLMANLGSDLERIAGDDVFRYWKEEVQAHLVEPDAAKDGFSLEDYPREYCYLASLWEGDDISFPTVLLEMYH